MSICVHGAELSIHEGSITVLAVDAIVNAANSSLLGGGGVDGAIHRAAGPDLLHECRLLCGCKTGEAKMTGGYRLPARHIIHTVGPVWQGGDRGEPELLRRCYSNAMAIAHKTGIRSLAFPAISTGIYHFPAVQAADIAVNAITQALSQAPGSIDHVLFACFGEEATALYRQKLGSIG